MRCARTARGGDFGPLTLSGPSSLLLLDFTGGRPDALRETRKGYRLCSTTLRFIHIHWLCQNLIAHRIRNPVQNLIRRIFDAGIGLVELACCLRGNLAKHITILQCVQSFKDLIRTHDFSSRAVTLFYEVNAGDLNCSGSATCVEDCGNATKKGPLLVRCPNLNSSFRNLEQLRSEIRSSFLTTR